MDMSKKEKRLESKRKKTIALLNLIETRVQSEGNMEGPEAKNARWSTESDDCGLNSGNYKNPTSAMLASIAQKPDFQACLGSEKVDDEYARARKMHQELQKSVDVESRKAHRAAAKYGPKIKLILENMIPFCRLEDRSNGSLENMLPPLFAVDLQHLLLLALMKNFSFWTPRWCRLSRPRKLSSVSLVVLQDVSFRDFEEHPDCFQFLKNSFLGCVEMVNPGQYNSSLDQDIFQVPLLISQIKPYTKREDIRQKILKLISKPTKEGENNDQEVTEKAEAKKPDSPKYGTGLARTGRTIPVKKKALASDGVEETFPRTSLMLSSVQLMEQGYPFPVEIKNKRYSDYAFSNDSYMPPTRSSPMFAVDCEMCETNHKDFELTRVSIVNDVGEVVYDELVKPYNIITNYLTRFSGMTPRRLAEVTKRVADVHRDLKEILPPDAILCGQSLWNDLNALKMFHPYVIDTAVIFNQSGDKNVRCGLRKLAFNFLGRKIQGSMHGHCSIEDARATMDLVKLKLSKGIEFGDAMLGGVYFPNISTYFQNPSMALNVEEIFVTHPEFTPTASPDTQDHHSSAASLPSQPPSSEAQTVSSQNACVESDFSLTQKADRSAPCVELKNDRGEEAEHKAVPDISVDDNVVGAIDAGDVKVKEARQSKKCAMTKQREVFFQQEGSTVKLNFLELLTDNDSTAGVVGSKALLSRLHPSYSKLEQVEVDSDAEACAQAARVNQERDFTWAELPSFAQALSGNVGGCRDAAGGAQKRMELFTQLDTQIHELATNLRTHSLLAVVMTGRIEEGKHLNAAVFIKKI